MADPIQDSDLAKRNKEERDLILGARDNPEKTKMPDGRSVSEFQATTYREHLAEAQAEEEVQIQRTREQSIANDPFYQGEAKPVEVAPVPAKRDVFRRAVDVDKPSDERL